VSCNRFSAIIPDSYYSTISCGLEIKNKCVSGTKQILGVFQMILALFLLTENVTIILSVLCYTIPQHMPQYNIVIHLWKHYYNYALQDETYNMILINGRFKGLFRFVSFPGHMIFFGLLNMNSSQGLVKSGEKGLLLCLW
jgi:hypothetical protein